MIGFRIGRPIRATSGRPDDPAHWPGDYRRVVETPGVKIVHEGSKTDLAVADADRSLDEIRMELARDAAYRLSLSWKITKREK